MTRSIQFSAVFAVLAAFVIATPALAIEVDLTATIGDFGFIDGVLFQSTDPQPTGTGFVDPFVQVGQPGGNLDITEAYNTTEHMTLDNGSSDQWNHSIMLSDVAIVTVDGVEYREFLLDINENVSMGMGLQDSYLSLDEVQIFTGGTADSSVITFDAITGVLDHDGTLIWQMDATGDNVVLLDYSLGNGSGSGDMFMYVPESYFAGVGDDEILTLYSKFGEFGRDGQRQYNQSDGFEEWWVREGEGTPPVPEPTAALVFGIGALLMGSRVRRQR